MKQIRTFFTAVCLCLLLSAPMTAWAAPEPEPVTWTEGMEGKPADVDAGEGAAGQKQETQPEQEGAEPQATGKNSGVLRIRNAAAGTGERLSGAVFSVHEKDGTKKGELTLQDGAASLSLPVGEYYLKQLKAPAGYGVEPARIAFAISTGETTLAEVTSEADLTNTDPQDIIPKTGERPPAQAYALSALCYAAALLCGFKLRRMDAGNRRKGGARLWQC